MVKGGKINGKTDWWLLTKGGFFSKRGEIHVSYIFQEKQMYRSSMHIFHQKKVLKRPNMPKTSSPISIINIQKLKTVENIKKGWPSFKKNPRLFHMMRPAVLVKEYNLKAFKVIKVSQLESKRFLHRISLQKLELGQKLWRPQSSTVQCDKKKAQLWSTGWTIKANVW